MINFGIVTLNQFIDYLHEHRWNDNYGVIRHTRRRLELHTMGWSENEDAIKKAHDTWFWVQHWVKSERGGHYYFDRPRRMRK